MRDRERKRTQIVARKDATAAKQTKYPSLFGDGGWHTNGTVMVGQYTQTKQKRLRAKTVKFGHGRHYKKGSCREQGGGGEIKGNLDEEIGIGEEKPGNRKRNE